jgi:glutamate/tyrosine decarboxylase-like PLP-dependent enzyme
MNNGGPVVDIWNSISEDLADFSEMMRRRPVSPTLTPDELRAHIEKRYEFVGEMPLGEVFTDVRTLLREGLIHITHPRYFGLFNPSVREAAVAADALVALYNPQLAAWSHAPAAQEIERHTLRFFGGRLGLPGDAAAHFTSGGAEANMTAFLAAMAHHFPGSMEEGLRGLQRDPLLYVTGESHHSFVKIARMAGLGTNAVRTVPVENRLRMDTDALAAMVRKDREQGFEPFFVVGTAGTTGAGVVDPLPEISRIARGEGLWFHADAAWGGAACLSERLADTIGGIGAADSITWDAHKYLSVPMGAGMVFCRHAEAFRKAFGVATSYMPAAVDADRVDPYHSTMQWSRRFIGLKVFMALAELGSPGYGRLIDHQAEMGDYLRGCLVAAGFDIVNATRLPVICFTHPRIEAGEVTTGDIVAEVQRRSRVWFSDVVLGGRRRVLRACITSYYTQPEDVDALVEEVLSSM